MWNPIQKSQQGQVTKESKMLGKLNELQLGKWHIFTTFALGLVWMFDGYQITILSLYRHQIQVQTSQIVFKALATAYQLGTIVGSFVFGISSFLFGRRKIFIITLIIYFFGVLLSGIQTNQFLFIFSRFLTGLSIGGQYTAIFTAVDQFLPPKYRGRVNIGIDGTWHLGGTLASFLTMVIGQVQHWRLMFLFGWVGIISLIIMRKNVPESPRWLLMKNRYLEANSIVSAIVSTVNNGQIFLEDILQVNQKIEQNERGDKKFGDYMCEIVNLLKQAITLHTKKFITSFSLLFCQAFAFNQIYYQYSNVLANKFSMNQQNISKYMLPISLMCFVSTLVVGTFFDEVGRRPLILLTYVSTAILVVISYQIDEFFWRQLTVIVLFLFASPASSSANLITSQIFPTSSRTIVMFVMFIFSMLGGILGIWVNNYIASASLMAFAGIVAFIFCPDGEKKSLQEIQKM